MTVLGVAQAAGSGAGSVNVDVNGNTTSMLLVRGLTVATGDVVLVDQVGSQWFITAVLYASAPTGSTDPPPAPPPAPKPTVTTGSLVVSPVETRSYRPTWGWRTDNTDVYQGAYGSNGNHTGCAFYGSKPRSIAGATVTDAKIKVRRLSAGTYAAQSTTLRLVTQSTRPGGAPTLTSSTSGPHLAVGSTDYSFDVPNSWAQAMVDGSAGGLAVFDSGGSPYVRFAGRGSWSPAFTLTISWRRG